MPIRISGLNSGLDTESIISALVSSYDYKKQKYVKAQTKLSWKQDAWKSLNTKVYSLYNSIGNMRYTSTYNLKKTSISDPTKATVTASSGAVNGSQKLKIKKLAQASSLTGGKITTKDKGTVTADTTLADLGYTSSSKAKFNINVAGEDKTIEVESSMKVSEVISKFSSAGVNASFDEKNARIYISSTKSGTANSFKISVSDQSSMNALSALGLATSDNKQKYVDEADTWATFNDQGKYDKTATKANIKNAVQALHDADLIVKEYADKVQQQQDIIDEMDSYDYTGMTDDEKAEKIAESEATRQAAVDEITRLGQEKTDAEAVLNNTSDDKYIGLITAADPVVVWYSVDVDSYSDTVFNRVDFAAGVKEGTITANAGQATRIEAQNSEIWLNDVQYTSDTNSYVINGLTIEATGETGDDELTVTTTADTSGIYDKIKEFLSEYNNIINEMMKLYNADSAKDYEPLTDDEKAEMSETEIEKWESKIKDSLLRRDTNLGSLITSLTTTMMGTMNYKGQTLSWSTFGIQTLGTLKSDKNENYAYHIDGDSEDSKTSGNEDKLYKALADDPDSVMAFVQDMATKLYSSLDSKMKSTTISSVYTVYNDKEMASEYSNYNTLINTWTDRVKDLEDSYYEKFSKMESALATLQGNSSSLSSLLG